MKLSAYQFHMMYPSNGQLYTVLLSMWLDWWVCNTFGSLSNWGFRAWHL